MKIAFQNFLTTLKRYKTASVLNIAGLTIAFIAFYILMAQVYNGLTFNGSIPDSDRVYINISPSIGTEDLTIGGAAGITLQTIEQSPDVEVGGLFSFTSKYMDVYKSNNGGYDRCEFFSYLATLPALEALQIEMISGDEKQLDRPNTIIISDVVAKTMGVGLGDMLYFANTVSDYGKMDESCEVVGVFKAFAKNSIFFDSHILRKLDDNDQSINILYTNSYAGVIKLRKGADIKKFEDLWVENYTTTHMASYGRKVRKHPTHFVALKDFYFSSYKVKSQGVRRKEQEQSDPTTIYSLMAVAILTVLIAFINFVNFFFALIPVRIRAVNIGKVFGATNRSLRWSFLFEALALTLISLGLALYLIAALQDTSIAKLVTCSLALQDNIATIAWILCIVVAMAIAAALYPAWYITSFSPSLAAKGRFGGSKAGQRLRAILSIVQFSISMALIIVTLACWLQYRHMTNYDMGFDYEDVMKFETYSSKVVKHNEAILDELIKNPMIVDATMSMGDILQPMDALIYRDKEKKQVILDCLNVRYNFLQFFRMPVDGEGFSPNSKQEVVITNEFNTIIPELENEFELQDCLKGLIRSCRFRSVNRPDVHYAIVKMADTSNLFTFYLRMHEKADYQQIQEFVQNVMERFGANPHHLNIRRVEEQITEMYAETRNHTVLLSLFSVASIIISLMGVFGIVIFETQYRRKEIAIRRVFGATTSGLLWMFNSRYVQIVVACFMVATPIAYYIIHEWQKSFVYKAPIGWWVYLSALAMVMLLTLALVTHRSLKAARENPADVVKGD